MNWRVCPALLSVASLVVLAAPTPALSQSCRDDFNGASQAELSPGWTVVRPNNATWSLTGGKLRIELEFGDLWQNWTNNCRNMFIRPAPSGDFTIETRVNVTLLRNINQAHILLYANDDNYLRFGPVLSNGSLYLDHVYEVGGGIAQQYATTSPSSSVVLRVVKFGSTARMDYSQDGNTWSTLGSVAGLAFAPTYVGIVAFDGSEPASASVAEYDYFRILSDEASVLFRERGQGSWIIPEITIPGIDHAGILLDGYVYEAHPGYFPEGPEFWDPLCKTRVNVPNTSGVQSRHSKGSFLHDSDVEGSSEVAETREVPLPSSLSREVLHSVLESKLSAPFLRLCDEEPLPESLWDRRLCMLRTLSPMRQKGGTGAYTCVGLVEGAMEEVGLNGGQGFIPDAEEEFTITDLGGVTGLPDRIPLLRPELLWRYASDVAWQQNVNDLWLGAVFDPVDFLIIDPLGRRLGFTEGTGELNEIPGALYSGDGDFEYVHIKPAVVGEYRIVTTSIGERSMVLVGGSVPGKARVSDAPVGEMEVLTISVGESQALSVNLTLEPNTINLKSQAPWLTGYIEPIVFDAASIDVATIRLADVVQVDTKGAVIGDHDIDGIPDVTVKFERRTLDQMLTPGRTSLEVTGSLVTGESFTGSDEVLVINPGGGPKAMVSPNPLNPAGVLRLTVPSSGPIVVKMFDHAGRLVRSLFEAGTVSAGTHEISIDGRGERGEDLATGVYYYRVETVDGVVAGKIVVLK